MTATNQRPNPYVGPRAFRVGETIYGRDRELRELLDLLIAERIILLHSPSGAGKSSLIQAGLIPKLQEEGFRVLPLIRVNQEPPRDLGTSSQADSEQNPFICNRYLYSTLLSLEEELPDDDQLPDDELAGSSLADYLDKRIETEIAEDSAEVPDSVMLIFDQFEEILSIDPTDRQSKADFFAELGIALRNRKLWALVSMREDYIAALDPYLRPVPTRLNNTYRLDLLGVEAARQAIQMPARGRDVDFTHAAAQKLVDDLRCTQIQQPDGTLVKQLGNYVEPVQLQVVCYRLWQNLDSDKDKISEQDVESVGDVDQSLAEYYAERVANAAQQTEPSERIIRDWFDQKLITESGIRGQVLMGPEKSEGLDNRTINMLQTAHLVRSEKRRGATWFELAHDRLIGPVRTNNLEWYQANLILLQRQAALWLKEDRPDHLLLRDQALVEAEEWAAEHPDELTPGDSDFLKASQEQLEHEQAERERAEQAIKLESAEKLAEAERMRAEEQALAARKLRQRAIFLAVLLLVAVGLAVAAGYLGNLATQESRAANTARAEAVTQQSIAEANAVLAEENADMAKDNAATAEAERAIADEQRFAAETARAVADNERNAASTARAEEAAQRATAEYNAQIARENEAEAQKQAAIASSRQSAAFSLSYLDNQTDLALLLGVEAYRITDTLEAKNALLSGLQRGLGRRFTRTPVGDTRSSVYGVAMSTDGKLMAWGDEDGTVTIWDYQAGRPLHVDSYSSARVWSVAFSPDGKTLASADIQSFITLWDVDSGEQIVSFRNQNQVLSLSWSPDSTRIAAAVGPHVVVWDVAGKTQLTQEDIVFDENLGFVVREVAWSPNGEMIAAACENSIVYILEPETGNISKQFTGHEGKVKSVAWAPNSALLSSGGDDRKVLLWDISRTTPIGELLGHSDNVISLAFSFDGSLLASGGDINDKSISFWDVQTLSLIENREDNSLSVESLTFVPRAGDVLLASGSRDGAVGLYEVITEQPLNQSLGSSRGEVLATEIDQNGSLLSARYRPSQADLMVTRLTDEDEEEVRSGLSNFRNVVSAAFSPDGKSLVYSTDTGDITIADVESGAEIATFTNAPSIAYALALNDRYLASSHCTTPSEDSDICQQNEIWLWDLTTGSPDGEPMTGHDDTITALAFSPDGNVLASGSRDKTIIHWDLETREPEGLPLSRHLDDVTSLAFSPDGNLQASGSSDQTIILWDVAADQPIGKPLRGFTADVLSLVFNSDGSSLYSGTRDGETSVWDTNIDSWIERACRLAGRSLDQSEWIEFFPDRPYDPACGETAQATPTPTSTPTPTP